MVWSPCGRLCEVSSGQFCIDQLFLSPGWISVSFQSIGHWLSLLNWFLCTLLLGEETCANGITALVSLLSRSLFLQVIFFFLRVDFMSYSSIELIFQFQAFLLE